MGLPVGMIQLKKGSIVCVSSCDCYSSEVSHDSQNILDMSYGILVIQSLAAGNFHQQPRHRPVHTGNCTGGVVFAALQPLPAPAHV